MAPRHQEIPHDVVPQAATPDGRALVFDYIQHSAHIPVRADSLFNLVRSTPATLKYALGVIVAGSDYVVVPGRF